MNKGVIIDGEPYGLPLNLKILPQYLKDYGYTTRAVGKWHLGFHTKEYTPIYRGFDSHFGYWGSKEDYYTHDCKIGLVCFSIDGQKFSIEIDEVILNTVAFKFPVAAHSRTRFQKRYEYNLELQWAICD